MVVLLGGLLLALAPKPIEVPLAAVAPAGTPYAAVLERYAAAVGEASGGRLVVKLHFGGALGGELELVTKCRRGQLAAISASGGALASVVPALHVLELPYLFADFAEVDRALAAVRPALAASFAGAGLRLGFFTENGFRHFATRARPIRAPADLAGLRMRAQESPVHLAMYEALSARAVPLPTPEVLPALATGLVDGFDQALLYAVSARWIERAPHLTLSGHIYQPAAVVLSAEWLAGVPIELQQILLAEAAALEPRARGGLRELGPGLLAAARSAGATVHEPTAAERAAFAAATRPAWAGIERVAGPEGATLLATIERALGRASR